MMSARVVPFLFGLVPTLALALATPEAAIPPSAPLALKSVVPPGAPIKKDNALARIAGRVITTRALLIEAKLDDPSLMDEEKLRAFLSPASLPVRELVLNRLIVQEMLREENRIFASETVSDAEIDVETQAQRKAFGAEWKTFQANAELSNAETRDKIRSRLLLGKYIRTRTEAALRDKVEPSTAIEDWVKQLRSRYKVFLFKNDFATRKLEAR